MWVSFACCFRLLCCSWFFCFILHRKRISILVWWERVVDVLYGIEKFALIAPRQFEGARLVVVSFPFPSALLSWPFVFFFCFTCALGCSSSSSLRATSDAESPRGAAALRGSDSPSLCLPLFLFLLRPWHFRFFPLAVGGSFFLAWLWLERY